ncbi:MAG: AroM family protein [Deferribacteraceae bacterium]|jgi:predicted nucleic acid-binding protein|nr:AroM family protein [Deferribacteraceae bacterium]
MHKIVIANSTPIIALLGVGALDILKALYNIIIIPEAVRDEVSIKNAHILDDYSWIQIKAISNTAVKEAFISVLHDGEVEVMLLAKELNADLVIIDDRLARRHAKYMVLTTTGTIGILLRAKSEGVIDCLKPILDNLLRFGFYVSDETSREVLRLANEL